MKKILRDSWLPHSDNDYQPSLLQKGAILGMGFLVLLSFVLANFQALLWQNSDWLVGAILPAVVVQLTNQEREDLAEQPLVRSSVLDQAANLKAAHMASLEYFSHDSPDGVTPWHWFDEVNYVYAHAGENLAVYFSDSDDVVDAWMNSPTHRANIVNKSYQEIGIGTAKGRYQGHDTVFVVQLFGTPAIPLPETNDSEVLATPSVSEVVAVSLAQATTSEEVELSVAEVLGVETEVISPEIAIELVEETAPEEAQVARTTETNNKKPAFLFSSPVATSSGLLPVISQIENKQNNSATDLSLVTQPNNLLRYLYIFMGALVILALWASVINGLRKHRIVEVGYGAALLLLMVGLFYVHSLVTGGVLIV